MRRNLAPHVRPAARALAAVTIYLVIAFAMSGLPFSIFGGVYGWSLLAIMAASSYFQMMGAVGKTMSDAQVKAMPYLILMMVFNGFFVTLGTAPSFMVWAIYISPLFYFIQQAAILSFGDTAAGQAQIAFYQYTDMAGTAVVVLCAMIVIFRTLQIVALKKLNNIER